MPILGIPRLPSVSTPPQLPAATTSKRYNPWAIASISLAASTVIGSWCLGGPAPVITRHNPPHQIKPTRETGGSLSLARLLPRHAPIAPTLALLTPYLPFFLFFFSLPPPPPRPPP